MIQKGGLTVMGQYFAEGTVLSVPSYTVHRDVGRGCRPERWFECGQNMFNPFSTGPS